VSYGGQETFGEAGGVHSDLIALSNYHFVMKLLKLNFSPEIPPINPMNPI
jgi:hypothetical protein